MEYLDTYDENGKFLGRETRELVHQNALWHNTVHCWLYDKEGNVYFQIRKEEGTLYTTASGHVAASETIKEAFGREIKEEIGATIDYNKAKLLDIVIWKMDKKKKDGTMFRDRAFANVYAYEFNGDIDEFDFDANEVKGLVKINAKEALNLLEKEIGEINAEIITNQDGKNVLIKDKISFNDFLINEHETGIDKYGTVLSKIIEFTNDNSLCAN